MTDSQPLILEGNPFEITKAVDLSPRQIQQLWVELSPSGMLRNPTVAMPFYLLGGKGSGKTHWMRYHSYTLQSLRYQDDHVSALDGIVADGYLGTYILLTSLNSERFAVPSLPEALSRTIFEYYFELWATQELLQIIIDIGNSEDEITSKETEICRDIVALLSDQPAGLAPSYESILTWCNQQQKSMDAAVNNIAYGGSIAPRVYATRGQLIFGIPKVLTRHVPKLRKVTFSYQLDEFESLTLNQQKYVNTLVRERTPPSTFRVGGRTWGVKTQETFSDSEKIKEGSEFTREVLDQRFRKNPKRWQEFCLKLIKRRIEASSGIASGGASRESIEGLFVVPDLSWKGEFLEDRLGRQGADRAESFRRLRQRLSEGLDEGLAYGLRDSSDADALIDLLKVPGHPLLEKINALLLFQAWFRGQKLPQAARKIAADCRKFVDGKAGQSKYSTTVQHYGTDMATQLLRDVGKRTPGYYGLKSFVRMSEGLPRTLIMLLKETVDWAIYNTQESSIGTVSATDQEFGVDKTSEWFFGEIRAEVDSNGAMRVGIERLASLFEINRNADKPIECSLITFSVSEQELSEETANCLRLAEQTSALIRIQQGEIDRNSRRRIAKFQLNAMLCPKWKLPIARRGTVRLRPSELELVFCSSKSTEFEELRKTWMEKMRAPAFGKSKRRSAAELDLFADHQ